MMRIVALTLFLFSSPICAAIGFGYIRAPYGMSRAQVAVANSYLFSAGMILLYALPFLQRSSKKALTMRNRVHSATMEWIVWLSVFTEIAFQIPHNLFPSLLEAHKGSLAEWPFYAYGLSDERWSNYNGGTGLDFDVWLINANDAILGLIVLAALVLQGGSGRTPSPFLVIATLFRDATLWRETVEYMSMHHRSGYALTTRDPQLRGHAIACLWLVNGIWLVAPLITAAWAYDCMQQSHGEIRATETKKRL